MKNRTESLIPGGVPRYVRCYDNGGETADRYTVCFTGRSAVERSPGNAPEYPYRAMSAHPFHPQGFGQWGSVRGAPCDTVKGWPPAMARRCRLGKRIPFADLPEDCRKLVARDYREIWGLD